MVVVLAALAGCSGDGEPDASGPGDGTGNDNETTTTAPDDDGDDDGTGAPPDVRVVTFNLLHGLPLGGDCPQETDGCQAATRLDLTWERLEEAGCPEVVGLQEVGPTQQERIPQALADVCDGAYQVVSVDPELPVEQWILSSLPVVDAASEPISGISRSIQWVRLDSAIGPVDVFNTHLVADVDDLPCTAELCGDRCEPGTEAGRCNPIEVLDVVERYGDPEVPAILLGDLNATIDDPRIWTLLDAGFVDAWSLAGLDECDPASGAGCTSGLEGDGPYGGLDRPENTRDVRIDFVLVRSTPGCELRADPPDDADGDGSATGPFAAEPVVPARSGVHWPSDHVGVLAELSCARS